MGYYFFGPYKITPLGPIQKYVQVAFPNWILSFYHRCPEVIFYFVIGESPETCTEKKLTYLERSQNRARKTDCQ